MLIVGRMKMGISDVKVVILVAECIICSVLTTNGQNNTNVSIKILFSFEMSVGIVLTGPLTW